MEIKYPIFIIIGIVVVTIIILSERKQKQKYSDGKKVANTKILRETEYYKKKLREYKILSNSIKFLNIFLIICTSTLISRIVSVSEDNSIENNRDILIGLDISTTEDEVNLEFLKKFKNIIPQIDGDRVGIVLFNTAPVVFCPLTDDYDYVNECLDSIIEQVNLAIENNGYPPTTYEKDGNEVATIWYGGVGLNSEKRGSSLIGDGLARNIVFIHRFKNKFR